MNGKEAKTNGIARRPRRVDFRTGKAPCLRASAQPEISLREEIFGHAEENSGACGSRKNGRRKQGYGGWDLSETQPTNRKVETEKKTAPRRRNININN